MKAGSIIDIAAAIVTVSLVTVIVSKPNSAKVISALGTAFTGAIKAASGR